MVFICFQACLSCAAYSMAHGGVMHYETHLPLSFKKAVEGIWEDLKGVEWFGSIIVFQQDISSH